MPPKLSNQPVISVVVPAYNRSATIADCLRSVQNQTYRNWEAIVVDDGSKDGTATVVEQIAREDARVRLIQHEHNRGAQAARNTAIRAAKGDWIAFLDSDDHFLPHSLETRLKVAAAERVSVVDSASNIIELDGQVRPYRVSPLCGQVYQTLLRRDGPMFQGLLVKKQALQKINYLDEQIVAYQEWDTSIRLAKNYAFGFEPAPTFIYDCRNPDTISKNSVLNGEGYEQVFHKHFFAILRHAGPRALAQHYRFAASWYERGQDQKAVNRCKFLALAWSCLDPRTVLRKTTTRVFGTK